MALLGSAGSETFHEIQTWVDGDVKPWVDGYTNSLLNRITTTDAQTLVRSAGQPLDEIIQRNVQGAVEKVGDAAPKVVAQAVKSAGEELDLVVQRNIDYALKEAAKFLSKEEYPTLESIKSGAKLIGEAVQNIQTLKAELSQTVGPKKAGEPSMLVSVIRTSRDLKHVIDGLNAFLPKAQELMAVYHKEKERERALGWRVMFGNTAVGLLLASFAYAVYLKLGVRMNAVAAIRIFWIAISVPLLLTIGGSLIASWRSARRSGGIARDLLLNQLSPDFVVPRVLYFVLLISANVFLQVYLS